MFEFIKTEISMSNLNLQNCLHHHLVLSSCEGTNGRQNVGNNKVWIKHEGSSIHTSWDQNIGMGMIDPSNHTKWALGVTNTQADVINKFSNSTGSGGGSVGRAVASDSRGPRFESSLRQKSIFNICSQLYWKDENKEKEARNGPFFSFRVV